MTPLRLAERVVEVIDWIAAVALLGYAVLAFLVGAMFGFLCWLDTGNLCGHEFTLVLGAALALVGGLCVLAARGMRRGTSWRWWIQLAPYPAFLVLFSVALCLGGDGIVIGKLVLCGR